MVSHNASIKKPGLGIDILKKYRLVNNLVYFRKLIETVVDTRLDEYTLFFYKKVSDASSTRLS